MRSGYRILGGDQPSPSDHFKKAPRLGGHGKNRIGGGKIRDSPDDGNFERGSPGDPVSKTFNGTQGTGKDRRPRGGIAME